MVELYNIDARYNVPKIIMLDNSPESKKALEKLMKTKTRKKIRSNWFIYKGKVFAPTEPRYIREYTNYNIDSIENDLRINDYPSFFKRKHRIIKNMLIEIYGNATKIYNPAKVPENAVPIIYKGKPAYIQITKSGIAITRGYFFIKDEIGEACTNTYCIEKQDGKWLIWFNNNFFCYNGRQIAEHCRDIEKNVVSYFDGCKLIDDYDKYIVSCRNRLKDTTISKKAFNRVTITFGDKKLYAPIFDINISIPFEGGL